MKRELTTREKVMLLVLVFLVISLGYFKLILEPIQQQIADLEAQTMQEQILVDAQRVQLLKMRKMEKLLEEMKANDQYHAIPAYDNYDAVYTELHAVLGKAKTYSLEFESTSQMDYILARPVSLRFEVADYQAGRAIIDRLSDSENFNLISDLSISDDNKGVVTISMRITYYEVMP